MGDNFWLEALPIRKNKECDDQGLERSSLGSALGSASESEQDSEIHSPRFIVWIHSPRFIVSVRLDPLLRRLADLLVNYCLVAEMVDHEIVFTLRFARGLCKWSTCRRHVCSEFGLILRVLDPLSGYKTLWVDISTVMRLLRNRFHGADLLRRNFRT